MFYSNSVLEIIIKIELKENKKEYFVLKFVQKEVSHAKQIFCSNFNNFHGFQEHFSKN